MTKSEKIEELAAELPSDQIEQLIALLKKLKEVRKNTLTRVKGIVVLASNNIHPVCKS
jgi:hypothetical protein